MLLEYDSALAVFHEAGLTDLDVNWLRGQAEIGKIPSTVIARKRRFLKEELDKVIAGYTADAVQNKTPDQNIRRRKTRKTRFNT